MDQKSENTNNLDPNQKKYSKSSTIVSTIAILILIGEVYLFSIVSRFIGIWIILLEVIITVLWGVSLMKNRFTKVLEGVRLAANLLGALRPEPDHSDKAGIAFLSTYLLFFGAFLIFFPGLITDIIGLLIILIKPARFAGAKWILHLEKQGAFSKGKE